FNSVSLDPPMILWSLSKSAASLPALMVCEHFAVHVLASSQQSLSDQFSKKGIDKFSGIPLGRGPSDIPLLSGCSARFICRMAYRYEGGDHIILVGEVVEFEHSGRAPLLFHSGKYGRVLPKLAVNSISDAQSSDEFRADYLGYLLGQASLQLYQSVKLAWQSLGLTECEYYVLIALNSVGEKDRQEIEKLIALGGHSLSEQALTRMIEREQLQVCGEGASARLSLAPLGVECVITLSAAAKLAEEQAMQELDAEDLSFLKSLLKKVIKNTRSE
ncbi:MAG TPA: flavin reductase family protein, partial [Pseudomonadales bacterium]|nr:flavin reductase family protein [Pseudomonadales bacterium]